MVGPTFFSLLSIRHFNEVPNKEEQKHFARICKVEFYDVNEAGTERRPFKGSVQ
jgi:hypothetical protein